MRQGGETASVQACSRPRGETAEYDRQRRAPSCLANRRRKIVPAAGASAQRGGLGLARPCFRQQDRHSPVSCPHGSVARQTTPASAQRSGVTKLRARPVSPHCAVARVSPLRRPDIDYIASQHRHTDAAPYHWTGEQQDCQQQRCRDHDRQIECEKPRCHGDWRNQRGHTQNAQHVEDIRADDIADGDLGLAADGGDP